MQRSNIRKYSAMEFLNKLRSYKVDDKSRDLFIVVFKKTISMTGRDKINFIKELIKLGFANKINGYADFENLQLAYMHTKISDQSFIIDIKKFLIAQSVKNISTQGNVSIKWQAITDEQPIADKSTFVSKSPTEKPVIPIPQRKYKLPSFISTSPNEKVDSSPVQNSTSFFPLENTSSSSYATYLQFPANKVLAAPQGATFTPSLSGSPITAASKNSINISPKLIADKKSNAATTQMTFFDAYPELGLRSNIPENQTTLFDSKKDMPILKPYFLSEAQSIDGIAYNFLISLRKVNANDVNNEHAANLFSIMSKIFQLQSEDQQLFFSLLMNIDPNDKRGKINNYDFLLLQRFLHRGDEKMINLNISSATIKQFLECITQVIAAPKLTEFAPKR